ncbi:hypothetical protein AAHC03_02053 [Spirometra sp. Aus1]
MSSSSRTQSLPSVHNGEILAAEKTACNSDMETLDVILLVPVTCIAYRLPTPSEQVYVVSAVNSPPLSENLDPTKVVGQAAVMNGDHRHLKHHHPKIEGYQPYPHQLCKQEN